MMRRLLKAVLDLALALAVMVSVLWMVRSIMGRLAAVCQHLYNRRWWSERATRSMELDETDTEEETDTDNAVRPFSSSGSRHMDL